MHRSLAFVALFVVFGVVHAGKDFKVQLRGVTPLGNFTGENVLEIYLLCDVGFEKIIAHRLPGDFRPGEPVVFPGGIDIDTNLGKNEEHSCYIYEIDEFTNFVDEDAEDDKNDLLGRFIINRDVFEFDNQVTLSGLLVSVVLTCSGCDKD